MAEDRPKPPESAEELLRRYAAGERNFRNADLRSANLRDADLRGADLRNTHLFGASLNQANLSGAIFNGAALMEADLATQTSLVQTSATLISAKRT